MNVLGVRFDEVTRMEAENQVRAFLVGTIQQTIFTPNPEMLVDASLDPLFLEALNRGSLNICDGTGVVLASLGKLNRIHGSDFFLDVCRVAQDLGKGVYLLGSEDESILMHAKNELQKKFPRLKIVGIDIGIEFKNSGMKELETEARDIVFKKQNDEVVARINAVKPDVLFVAFGHKKQEWWIDRFLPSLPSVNVAMGVGGTFDFLGGKLKRAPVLFQRLGIEWVWRLLQEPWRLKRIWKATARFLCLYATRKHD